jgi:bifunctional non-homologous end joining protein LigD
MSTRCAPVCAPDAHIWVKPKAVVRIDFAEWTGADKLRNTKFVVLRDDKDPRKVVKET